jgi:hypothetical protein
MALIPLNTFKTKTATLTTSTTATVYTAPVGTTAIVLMAQIANMTSKTQTISFVHYRKKPVLADAQGNGYQPGLTPTYLVKDFSVPASDAAVPLGGKLIIEELDSVRCYCSTATGMQLTLSILESANQ